MDSYRFRNFISFVFEPWALINSNQTKDFSAFYCCAESWLLRLIYGLSNSLPMQRRPDWYHGWTWIEVVCLGIPAEMCVGYLLGADNWWLDTKLQQIGSWSPFLIYFCYVFHMLVFSTLLYAVIVLCKPFWIWSVSKLLKTLKTFFFPRHV